MFRTSRAGDEGGIDVVDVTIETSGVGKYAAVEDGGVLGGGEGGGGEGAAIVSIDSAGVLMLSIWKPRDAEREEVDVLWKVAIAITAVPMLFITSSMSI